MNFLTDELRLSAALAGTALLVGKVWDAVIDPFIGHFSDRTRSRWGRRRPYLLFSIPFGITFVLMFTNPNISGQTGKFIWVAVIYILLCTAYSLTNIPYNALLPEMTGDYNERTGISGFKQIFAVFGTLLGAGAALPIMGLFPTRTAGFIGMASVFGFLGALSLLVTFFSIREPSHTVPPAGERIWKSLRDVFANRPFILLLTAWFTNSTAVAIAQTMLIYYYKYVLQDESAVTLAMISLLLATIITFPLWIWLAKKIGKKGGYLIGMSMTIFTTLGIAFGADQLGVNGTLALMMLAGVGFGSHYVLPWAMAPDTIEYDYARSGRRREGIYYSVWTFMVALGGALAGFLVGQGLDIFGYVPDAVQSARSILGIRLLIGPLPALLFVLGNTAMAIYPLTRERYEQVQSQIRERENTLNQKM
jgi:glycoside/pentoside/hexuronide:cation symporter, GPH family